MYILKEICIILFWHVIFINFVGDKTCELYVLNKYISKSYRQLYVLICKIRYFRNNIFLGWMSELQNKI